MGSVTSRRRHLPAPLAAAGVAALLLAAAMLAALTLGGWPFAWDRAILQAIYGAGPPVLRRAMIDVTALGSGTVLTLVVVLAAGLLLAQRLWLTALLAVTACWSGGRVVALVKDSAARLRPDVEHLVPVTSASFPSGHASGSAVVYLTLAALASQVIPDTAGRRYLSAAAVLLVGAIGTSRVYLGVHWPSDVAAGWCFGTGWALAWWWLGVQVRSKVGGER